MQTSLPKHDVVLLGVGHTNAHVLRMWKMQPPADAQLTCVSNFPRVTYSGMMPGVLAGDYPVERMQIDLVRSCAAAGARLILAEANGLDLKARKLHFADRPPIDFDVLSVGIGSMPTMAGLEFDQTLVTIKPMQTFLTRLEQRVRETRQRDPDRPCRVAVVGGGVAGLEITLCLPRRLRQWLGDHPFEQLLVTGTRPLGNGLLAKTQRCIRNELAERQVRVLEGERVVRVGAGQVETNAGTVEDVDLVIWATSAVAPPLLGKLGLPTDDKGFLLTRPTLQSVADVPVFAVGDSGTIENSETAKAGVFAVRQGRFLWENIQRTLRQERLQEYHPQRDFLKLLNLGDGRAVAEYKGVSVAGRWPWLLKDQIDRRFMDKYQDYSPMEMAAVEAGGTSQMRCAGCGGKVGGSVLSRVLARLDIPDHEHVLLGLDQPDDAAIVQPPGGRPLTVTADFFAAPLDDPYLSGRLAALNSASDLFACGAKPLAALALATIPVGKPRQQEELLYQLLSGSLDEFRRMGATLIGGHTIEGPQQTIGFAMLADQGDVAEARTKAKLTAGDQLVLTKPLGSGVLLAAQMQALCPAEDMTVLLETMLLSNEAAAALSNEFAIRAMTDVTGFGLAGHLLEMLKASDCGARLQLDAMPLLPGVESIMTTHGIESTLAPANRAAEGAVRIAEARRAHPAYPVLFDPQTSGGMLLAVPGQHVDAVLARLADQSAVPAAVIGEVTARPEFEPIVIA